MRLDMLMVIGNELVIVENKYGIGAIGGNAGIKKHYNDLVSVFDNDVIYSEIVQSVVNISSNLYELGLTKKKIDASSISSKKYCSYWRDTIRKAVHWIIKLVKLRIENIQRMFCLWMWMNMK